ncbi:response regulator transcription factor [Pedobacter endophyticus]|uniref:Response regulator transcription factor n=1 Tax=Pedobacter endophyticus TaxID=2789740 RepID=A0A7S9L1Q4_9SPHI|nr:response regulator [Pedobacter endophyticus]QPH40885.1 response regulator transcription factor [Pedobacter endophyticus]
MTKKLLICDDDINIIEMLEIVLDDTPIEIITETDSKKVFDLIKERTPNLVLLDLWMPVVSGDQVLRQIRESEQIGDLPVLIMSAAQDGKEVAMRSGADGYIAKPFDIDELIAKVEELIGMN